MLYGSSGFFCYTRVLITFTQVFELLTAEYLFDPQGQGELFTKDDDHMAQVIELLGDFPIEVKMGGKYSRELFDHNGMSLFWSTVCNSVNSYYFTIRCSAIY